MMDLARIAARVAAGAGKSFYVDWEGRGYSPKHMQADLALMKAELGDGPIFSGGSEDFMGHFFSAQPALGQLVKTRGGQTADGSAYAADDVTWDQHESWDALVQALQLEV